MSAARLDHVRVERALYEEARVAQFARLLLEHPDELLADDLAFGLGIGHAGETSQEPVLRLDRHQRHLEGVAERGDHLVALVLAHQAVVHEDAGELIAHGPVHQQGGDRRVDAPGEPADHALARNLGPDPLDLLLDHRCG